MDVIRRSCFMFLVVLLCASLAVSSECRRTREEDFLCEVVDPVTGEVDDNLAQLLWYSCGIDLSHLKEVVEDLNLCLPEEIPAGTDESNSRSQSQLKSNLVKLNNMLHPHLKQTLLHCIRKANLLLHVTRGGYLESLYPNPDAPMQDQRKVLPQNLAEILIRASPPAPATKPTQNAKPRPQPPPKPFFPVDSSSLPAVDNNSTTNSGSGTNAPADNKTNHRNSVIIAVVVTAAVTFVAAVLFLCCGQLCRTASGDRQNDERPLLTLSMSDHSVGFGNLIKEEKLDVSLGAVGGTATSLKPPPGRVGSTLQGMPPLKPPPGRAEPSLLNHLLRLGLLLLNCQDLHPHLLQHLLVPHLLPLEDLLLHLWFLLQNLVLHHPNVHWMVLLLDHRHLCQGVQRFLGHFLDQNIHLLVKELVQKVMLVLLKPS